MKRRDIDNRESAELPFPVILLKHYGMFFSARVRGLLQPVLAVPPAVLIDEVNAG
ncbi:hypothetical protein D3C76_1790700 [compost metagenome]